MTETEKREAGGDEACLIDIAAGLVLAVMSVVTLLWLIPGYVELGTSKHDVGPAFFPRLTAFAILGFSTLLVITKAVRFKKGNPELSGKSILIEIIIWVTISSLTVFALSKLGFIVTALMLVGLGAIVCGYRSWWVVAVLSIVFPLIIDQAAWIIFTVELP